MTATGDLFGLRVVVTRAIDQGAPLVAAIAAAGGTPIVLPLLELRDPVGGLQHLSDELRQLRPDDWLAVTSPNGARRVVAAGPPEPHSRLAVIAAGTAAVFLDAGWTPELVPADPSSTGMVEAFPPPDGSARVLVAQGDAARPTLAEGLRKAGWRVDTVIAYENVQPAHDAAAVSLAAEADVVVFASPSAVERHVGLVGHTPVVAVCIGAVTAASAASQGFRVITAPAPTTDALMAAIRSVRS